MSGQQPQPMQQTMQTGVMRSPQQYGSAFGQMGMKQAPVSAGAPFMPDFSQMQMPNTSASKGAPQPMPNMQQPGMLPGQLPGMASQPMQPPPGIPTTTPTSQFVAQQQAPQVQQAAQAKQAYAPYMTSNGTFLLNRGFDMQSVLNNRG